ncbi:unnamed protein product [Cuscuta epithymum]|uniref:Uncharacterized protein n=1 Tax=Cuscuta epithymum TaxID=186058 RepID=A0AAV0GJE1_9ASTE|nr:unnamed protein product [Cuscuta epithymum]
MGEDHMALVPSDRAAVQALVVLKKGAYLLKYGRIGKPKLCPFRLSEDEKMLILYCGEKEKHLRLSSITDIIHGQNTKNLNVERETQCISLVYANGDRSLDLICKDKIQAQAWFLALKFVISRSHSRQPSGTPKNKQGVQSCISSPASYIRRRQSLGVYPMSTIKLSQVQSWSGSPNQSFSEKGYSDGLSRDSFFSEPSSTSCIHNALSSGNSSSPYVESDSSNQREADFCLAEIQADVLKLLDTPVNQSAQSANYVLRDVFIWGKGVEGGFLGGGVTKLDALLPKVIDSTIMLDVETLSLGQNHACLATKQGEVFSWGEGKHGRLGHKVDIDAPYPKMIESLNGVHVKSVSCGEYQTCALAATGELYTWGDNFSIASPDSEKREKKSPWLPYEVFGSRLDNIKVASVSCGEWHTSIVSTSGKLFTYGDGTFGALGHGNTNSLPHPKVVESLRGLTVKSVACGSWHTAAIVETVDNHGEPNHLAGKLFTWGDGDKGKLGHSDQDKKLVPTSVAKLAEQDFFQVSCGTSLTVVLSCNGKVYTIGSPQGKDDRSITLVQGKLKDEFVREISAGSYHVVALSSKGNVYAWGRGGYGQLGLGDRKERNLPNLVEALLDQQVEHICCGPNSTAAICLHKAISSNDQSTCKGCNLAFGITRKKHNCYNCGALFCRTCCSKKCTNAFLAPNKSKPSRVCDPCFNQLRRNAQLGMLPERQMYSPRTPSTTRSYIGERDEREQVSTTCKMTTRRKCFSMSSQLHEKKAPNHQEKDQNMNLISSWLDFPKWGHVHCPQRFQKNITEQKTFHATAKDEVGYNSPVWFQMEPNIKSSALMLPDCSKLDDLLLVEVQKLRNQVEGLKKLCRLRTEKIQESQLQLEEVWLFAKAEASRRKAACEVTKALTSKLHAMSGSPSDKDGGHSIADGSCISSKTLRIDTRKTDSLCSSPIVFSSTSRSFCNKENNGQSLPGGKSCETESDFEQAGLVTSGHEWVEQYQPGVYITISTSQSGEKTLKRVRFSRKRFTDKEAQKWWNDNQLAVYQNYNADKCSVLNQRI